MSKISVELIPSNKKDLIKNLSLLKTKFYQVNMINIPDLLCFDLRSWDACGLALNIYNSRIPHIRSIDFDLKKLNILFNHIDRNKLKEILVITGDIPKNKNLSDFFLTKPVELIKALHKEKPNLKIYTGIDPYRSSFEQEVAYIQEKINVGSYGFFTQPFFDLEYFMVYRKYFKKENIFLGICPVLDERSRRYWENINKVVFPKDFSPVMEWNINFAHQALELAKKENFNIYFMPIRINFIDYLTKIFN